MVKLSTACRRDDSSEIYKALRADMAAKMEKTDSGRDYAAIAKSFIEVQERIDAMEPPAKPIVVNRIAAASERRKASGG